MKKTILTTIGLVCLCTAASATVAESVAITVSGTAQATEYGYVQGQLYSFTWVLYNDHIFNEGHDYFDQESSIWYEEVTSESPIFSDVYADGLSGTYSRPSSNENSPYNRIILNDSWPMYMTCADESGISLGLAVDVNGTEIPVKGLYYNIIIDPAITETGTADLAGFFGNYIGSYSAPGEIKCTLNTGDDILFDATSMTISTVPEPATMALLGLGGLFIRRRKA